MVKPKGRKNLKKMAASLSALGAGALLGAGSAEAGVVYSGPLNIDVGFGPSGTPFYFSGPIGNTSSPSDFSFFAFNSSYKGLNGRGVVAGACGCFGFLTSHSFLKLFPAGAKWPQGSAYFSSYRTARIGRRQWGTVTAGSGRSPYTVHDSQGVGPFSDKYALFSFHSGPDTFYGWIHLSFLIDPAFGGDPSLGPDLIIHDWAYGDPNQVLAAGETPEPATVASTGLAALALGAVGLRNWRRQRKARKAA